MFDFTNRFFEQINMNVFKMVTATRLTNSDISEDPCAYIQLTFLLIALR